MIIGLAGYARAGKSEAANALREDGWKVVAFADKLREFLYMLNPIVKGTHHIYSDVRAVIDRYGWDGYKETPYGTNIRQLIQTLGTECGRDLLGENVWVDATLKPILSDSGDWVIQDVRFPNEAERIEALGGKVIRISKPGVGPLNAHSSETALNSHSFLDLANDGTIEDLHWKMRKLVEMMRIDRVKSIARAARIGPA